eukprot:scaffold24265_cov27-Prasinocladus_malaysianus.AAC.1
MRRSQTRARELPQSYGGRILASGFDSKYLGSLTPLVYPTERGQLHKVSLPFGAHEFVAWRVKHDGGGDPSATSLPARAFKSFSRSSSSLTSTGKAGLPFNGAESLAAAGWVGCGTCHCNQAHVICFSQFKPNMA